MIRLSIAFAPVTHLPRRLRGLPSRTVASRDHHVHTDSPVNFDHADTAFPPRTPGCDRYRSRPRIDRRLSRWPRRRRRRLGRRTGREAYPAFVRDAIGRFDESVPDSSIADTGTVGAVSAARVADGSVEDPAAYVTAGRATGSFGADTIGSALDDAGLDTAGSDGGLTYYADDRRTVGVSGNELVYGDAAGGPDPRAAAVAMRDAAETDGSTYYASRAEASRLLTRLAGADAVAGAVGSDPLGGYLSNGVAAPLQPAADGLRAIGFGATYDAATVTAQYVGLYPDGAPSRSDVTDVVDAVGGAIGATDLRSVATIAVEGDVVTVEFPIAYEDLAPTEDQRFAVLFPGLAVATTFVLEIGEERTAMPQANFEFEFEYDPDRVTIGHRGGDTISADELTIRVDGRPADTQFADRYDIVAAGDDVIVAASTGETVRIVWSDPDSDRTSVLARYDAAE
ncbi:hypothetical protein BRD17_02460 [Halobacteriales archaeon SW_7_68_16]|nr:MAG: hypothetical protein BRD17_02460 [Halobacteriales archaeon SW_7_68_16]